LLVCYVLAAHALVCRGSRLGAALAAHELVVGAELLLAFPKAAVPGKAELRSEGDT